MGLLLMAMLLSASDLKDSPAKQIEMLRVPSEVYWASYRAAGAKLCDQTLRNDQERQFDKQYGSRVAKLISILVDEESKRREEDNLIAISSCLSFASRASATAVLSRALDDFEPTLEGMERRHGIGNPCPANATGIVICDGDKKMNERYRIPKQPIEPLSRPTPQ